MSASDSELLQSYVAEKSEPSFRELIERRLGLVYSVALRNAGFDATAAEEVAQQVFILLSQKAGELTGHPSLTAWLFTATRQIAMRYHRSELRRRVRDQKAHEMSQAISPDSLSPDWTSLRPVIDEAIAELDETDQRAVLWRFFEKQGYAGIGARLGVSEEAARKRVTRALDTLHGALSRRGVTSTAAAIGLALEGNAVANVPEGLAAKVLGSVAGTDAFVVVALAPAVALSAKATLFTGTKVSLGLAGLVVACTFGYRVWRSSSSAPVEALSPAGISESASRPAGEPTDPMARFQAAVQARAAKSAADLEEARRRLREVLTRPPRAQQYPPKPLAEALALFQGQMGEAVPILVEAFRVEDSETQAWALSGLQRALQIWTGEDPEGTRRQAMSELRPLLGKVLSDSRRPDLMRMISLGILYPTKPHRVGSPDSEVRPDLESLAEVERALHATPRKDDTFRFTIADTLIGMGDPDPDTEQVIRRLIPMLDAPVEEDRILAAYAIAKAPVEKPAATKTVLLATLGIPYHLCRGRAAEGLGFLGTNAVEAVPALLEYARTVPYPTTGEQEQVLTAACRIQPGLRAAYPGIDVRLRQEEQARELVAGKPVPEFFRTVILRMATEGDAAFGKSLLRGVAAGANAEEIRKQREPLLAKLELEMQSGSVEEKATFRRAAELVRTTPETTSEEESAPPKPTDIRNLPLAARVVLSDEHNAKESQIEEAIEQFESEKIQTGVFPAVTKESAEAFAKILEEVDPAFCRQWREQVLKDQPWLDRVMPK